MSQIFWVLFLVILWVTQRNYRFHSFFRCLIFKVLCVSLECLTILSHLISFVKLFFKLFSKFFWTSFSVRCSLEQLDYLITLDFVCQVFFKLFSKFFELRFSFVCSLEQLGYFNTLTVVCQAFFQNFFRGFSNFVSVCLLSRALAYIITATSFCQHIFTSFFASLFSLLILYNILFECRILLNTRHILCSAFALYISIYPFQTLLFAFSYLYIYGGAFVRSFMFFPCKPFLLYLWRILVTVLVNAVMLALLARTS